MTVDIPELMRSVNLAQMVERDGVTLRGQPDRERYGACPKCGGRDRFHLRSFNGREWFFCRQCHDHRGDAIEYLRWLHGMTTGEAIRALGGHAAIPATAKHTPPARPAEVAPAQDWQRIAGTFIDECAARLWTPAGAKALAYLHGRGLNDDTVRRFKLGYHDKGQHIGEKKLWADRGITIPCIVLGEVWSVNIRRPAGDPKYRKLSGSRASLFNYDALAGAHTALLCGGEFDAMLAQQHAPAGAVCLTFGSETKTPSLRWVLALKSVERLLIAFDNDVAGESGATHWATIGQRVHVPSGKDITEYWQAGDVAAWIQSLIGDDSREAAHTPATIEVENVLAHLQAQPLKASELIRLVAKYAGCTADKSFGDEVMGKLKQLWKSKTIVQLEDKRWSIVQTEILA